MHLPNEIPVDELALILWDELQERLIQTDPSCPDLIDQTAGHDLDLRLSWNVVDGVFTGTLSCNRCPATTAWSIPPELAEMRAASKFGRSAHGVGDMPNGGWWPRPRSL